MAGQARADRQHSQQLVAEKVSRFLFVAFHQISHAINARYKRFIDAAGGWAPFQVVLTALDTIAKRHSVPISAVAIRYVLDLPAVASVIIGSRLSVNSLAHAKENLKAFSLRLSDDDRDLISEAQKGLKDIPFDCGDEYRRAPFLTASGVSSPFHFSNYSTEVVIRECR